MVRKPRSPLRGPWGGWEAGSRCLWPQTYKSKRGASAGRGAAGLVGEAGPFLLGEKQKGERQWLGKSWDGVTERSVANQQTSQCLQLKGTGHSENKSNVGAAGLVLYLGLRR